MAAWLCLLFVALNCFIILRSSYQTPLTKKLNFQSYEDYSFEGVLNRAKEECSYMSLVNDTVVRNRALQIVKEKMNNNNNLKEFHREKETGKQKVLEVGSPQPNFMPPRHLHPPLPPLSMPPPFHPPTFLNRHLYKRSAGSHGRRRKGSSLFSEVSFADHNNCSSRCLFARMEMVDANGFPDESLITKLFEDRITNKRIRTAKTKKVNYCFKKMEEVAFDDGCVFSSRLFDCLDLNEAYSWSGTA